MNSTGKQNVPRNINRNKFSAVRLISVGVHVKEYRATKSTEREGNTDEISPRISQSYLSVHVINCSSRSK